MDDIGSLFGVIFLIVVAARWLTTSNKFTELRTQLTRQSYEIDKLKRAVEELSTRTFAPTPTEQPVDATPAPEPVATAPITPPAVEHEETPIVPPADVQPPPMRPSAPPAPPKIKPRQLEQQFGGRAFVWVGGVALALAGFYLVKYSIDTGLLTEQVRCVLGVLFGLALLGGSYFVRAHGERVANGVRIGQALAGAGIADLYGSLFAATTLYHLLPSWLGFGAMAATTAAALVLSLRHGAPIALLGLIGGYATPALVEGEPNAPLLFGYLYLVFAGLMGVARGKNWWWLSIPASLVAFAWVTLWLTGPGAAQDAAWLSTFLLAIGITSVITTQRRGDKDDASVASPRTWARFLPPAGTVILAGFVAYGANFGMFEWAMFGLFSLGAVGLAAFDGKTYFAIPWIALTVNLAMLVGWDAQPVDFAIVAAAFFILFCASGQLLLSRSLYPLSWAALSAVATAIYFLVAYDELHVSLAMEVAQNRWLDPTALWTALAFAGAIIMTAAAARPFVLGRDTALRHRLQAIFAIAAALLVSVGLAILLHEEYLSFAIAVQIFAIAWLRTRVDIPVSRCLAYVLTAQFALLLLPDAAQMFLEAVGVPPPGTTAGAWPLITTALFRYAIPAALFAGANHLLRDQKDDTYETVLELGAVALLATTIYKILQAVFFGHAFDMTLVIGCIFTNILLALAITFLRYARAWNRERLFWAGAALGVVALFRIVALGLLVFDPLWSHQAVGVLPILNGLLPVYLLPALLLYTVGSLLEKLDPPQIGLGVRIASYLLAFIWLSLAIRQVFNGAYLDNGHIANAEVYAYSAVWLAVGIALLFAAALRKDMTMRFASLAVMLLVVGKVFLYDAAQLTGLWRVVSFLGLGLSLLALSWFYSRFIFVSEEPETAA